MQPASNQSLLERRLESIFVLDTDEVSAIRNLSFHMAEVDQDVDLVREGDKPTRCCVLFDGFTCWSKTTANGSRQILNIHVPGDMPDLQSVHIPVMDSTLTTLTKCRVGYLDHSVIRSICSNYPKVAAALWKMTLIEAGTFRAWIANIGGRPAYNRIAHLLCEFMTKLQAVGLTNGRSCPFPFTQQEMADATGLSIVHMNRNLQKLRAQGLIELREGVLWIGDWHALRRVADFDPTYLHLLPD